MLRVEEYEEALRGRDPEMAFVLLETRFRETLEKKLDSNDNNYTWNLAVIEYLNHSIAAARGLGISSFNEWEVPKHPKRDDDNLNSFYHDFMTAVDHFKVLVQIEKARSHAQFSVTLDPADKTKIHHFAEQIREIIQSSSLRPSKKERLFSKLIAFLKEVDLDRTKLEAFSDFVISLAHTGGEAAQELEPARKWLDSISRLLGHAKEFEDSAPQISHAPPRQIPGPPRALPSPAPKGDMDDEIPF